MKIDTTLLDANDLEFIRSVFDREPNENEIAFIKAVILKAINQIEYQATVNQFDEKASRKLNNRIYANDSIDINIASGVIICSEQNEIILQDDQSIRKQTIQGSDIIINLFCSHFVSNKSFNKTASFLSNRHQLIKKISSGVIYTRASVNKFYNNNIYYSFTMGTTVKDSKNNKINKGSKIFQVFTKSMEVSPGKEGKIFQLGKWLNNQIDVERIEIVNEAGVFAKLVNILNLSKLGAEISLGETARRTLNRLVAPKADSLILLVNSETAEAISEKCCALKLKFNEIGIISANQEIKIHFTDSDSLVFPLEIFNRFFNKMNTIHLTNKVNYTQVKNIPIKSPKNYNTIFKKLLSACASSSENRFIHANKNVVEKPINEPISIDLIQLNQKMILSHSDNFHYHHFDPRTGGQVAIANAVRHLACTGAKPVNLIINNIFPSKVDIETIELGQELLQGQEEAVSALNIPVADRTMTYFEDLFDQNIFALGKIPDNSRRVNIKVKHAGDFISALGSHRGELGGSLYNDEILKRDYGVLPKVDLSMENRIIDVLNQASQYHLIKSAINVSRGGLAVTLALMLSKDNPEIGLRIYISRKLLNEELLFGETQGLVLISIGENDLMEFERICMMAGVPSTTIGRVTSDGHFSFNDLINVASKNIHAVLEKNLVK